MFEPISEKQFQKAREIAAEVRHLISLRDNLIDKGELDADLVLPSIMWKAITLSSIRSSQHMKVFVRGACTRIHSRKITSVMGSIMVTTRRPLGLFGGTGG